MSSKRWPAGTLRDALVSAHRRFPDFTAPMLARFVGCDAGCARAVLRQNRVAVPKEKPSRIIWTDELKQAVIDHAKRETPVFLLEERLGISSQSILRGAMQIIAENAALAPSPSNQYPEVTG